MKDNTKYTSELAFMYVMDAIASNPAAFEYVMSNGECEHKFDGYHVNTKYVSHTYWVSVPFKSGTALFAKASFYKRDMLSSKSIFDGPSIRLTKFATGSIVDETFFKHPVWYSIFGLKIKKTIITERIQNPEFAYRLSIGLMEFRLDEFMYNKLLETYKSASSFTNMKKNVSHDAVIAALDAFEKKQEQEILV